MEMLFIFGGAFVLILLIIGIVISATSERSLVEERLGKYLEEEEEEKDDESGSSVFSDWVNRQVARSSFGERLAKNLAQADMKFKPGEYIALVILSTLGLGAFFWFIGGRDVVSGILGTGVGFFLPGFFVRRQKAQRLVRFNEQLPDMLNLVVNGLRAGFSTMQAMEAVSKELPVPISDEFRRVVQEMQIGIPMEKALENLLRRIPSEDLDFIITAINVQREVGGNLAEILDIISHTIRERVRIKGEIRVLTAQVMYSGRALSVLPFIVVVILWFVNREYMMEFFDNLICGIMAVTTALGLISIGYFIMSRIANIEV